MQQKTFLQVEKKKHGIIMKICDKKINYLLFIALSTLQFSKFIASCR